MRTLSIKLFMLAGLLPGWGHRQQVASQGEVEVTIGFNDAGGLGLAQGTSTPATAEIVIACGNFQACHSTTVQAILNDSLHSISVPQTEGFFVSAGCEDSAAPPNVSCVTSPLNISAGSGFGVAELTTAISGTLSLDRLVRLSLDIRTLSPLHRGFHHV